MKRCGAFPRWLKSDFSVALYQAQLGGKHALSKPLRGVGSGVLEVGRVYVLHAFQKESKSGFATPQSEINLIKQRLRRAIEMHDAWEKQNG